MKITILTVGSRGDIEPFVALGEGLQLSGHAVTIATEARFEIFVKERSLKFAVIPGDTHAALNTEECQKALNRKNNTEVFFKILTNASAYLSTQTILQSMQACEGAEHIICTPWCLHTGYFISQQLSLPMSVASGNATVLSYTKYFHNLMFPFPADWWPDIMRNAYNSLSHKIIAGQWWKSYNNIYRNSWKQATGFTLPQQDPMPLYAKTKPLLLYGYSRHILPKPADWESNYHVTGYWLLKQNTTWQPPGELENFIHEGTPPIYIGFGSMNNSALKEGSLENMIFETVQRTGQRAVVLNQGLNFEGKKLPENIFASGPVPFRYLFPKMSLLVHHAGAGTTALGFMSGVPQVLTPLIVDQRFWAWGAHKAGVAANPLHWYNLNADALANTIIKTIENGEVEAKAKELSTKINDEQGVETAVSIFNNRI